MLCHCRNTTGSPVRASESNQRDQHNIILEGTLKAKSNKVQIKSPWMEKPHRRITESPKGCIGNHRTINSFIKTYS